MAGLQCGGCGKGIRYHDEPNGIELILFPIETWKNITESKYDPNNEKMRSEYLVPSPYLYQSDSVYEDFMGLFNYMWRRPQCGTLHVFDRERNINVIKTYIPTKRQVNVDLSCGYSSVIYDDLTWFEVAEHPVPNTEIERLYPPTYYAVAQGEYLALFTDKILSRRAGSFEAKDVSDQHYQVD